jgi:hypothetical protein
MLKFIFVLLGLFAGAKAQALIEFSAAEKAEHQRKLPVILQTAAQCLEDTYADHIQFFSRYQASKYYGNRRPDYRTVDQRASALKATGLTDVQAYEIARQQVGTACITMTVECLEKGFQKAGGLSLTSWGKIKDHLIAVDMLGTDLQIALQDLGWKIYYWNPATSEEQMVRWDQEDRRIAPLSAAQRAAGRRHNSVWGNHLAHYTSATQRSRYYHTRVDNATKLVGFGDRPPAAFASVPFFVGIAHVGYHVFPGRFGEVIEAHSMRNLRSIDNIETAKFNPLGSGGAPKWTPTEKYRSGLIAVPYDF